ncbi:23S rRNA (guanosine(2251)-2'-O)-methyltransferase RlmB [Legionella sp. 16cNR16C]|uniref:23S rRNA (guanosine(2251)-2'-O)-methyltransferase RlmB n=1 Tax=Legionella sp. 16cNR16C TaxID=2905656 RepID=UPI001E4D6D99|nr:23S rRNA (guanosine(2251)-2'-O)-methyltransferase RlmB [Legionella sp. 16cNR16C]MCE3045505.1 23S rRNA (guanosine(2251)-2'-O)-methyltransferase RlmB [Legionella sp. 16cNR16C]
MADQMVYGLHAVTALLKKPHRPVHKLLLSQERQDQRMQQLVKLAEEAGIPMEFLSVQKMKQQYPDLAHQGVLAITGRLPEYVESDLAHMVAVCKKPPLILILDSVTDPHNLGACLRTADAAGVDFVIIPKDKSAGITPVVSKVACGAAESIPVVKVTNLVRAMEIIKQEGVWLYGAAGEAQESIYQLELTSSVALVMGAEGSGLRRLTREHCDGLFSLPMLGSVESLNVSVAAAVSLYEAVRQRLA